MNCRKVQQILPEKERNLVFMQASKSSFFRKTMKCCDISAASEMTRLKETGKKNFPTCFLFLLSKKKYCMLINTDAAEISSYKNCIYK